MPQEQRLSSVPFSAREWTVCLLLLLATVQCVRSIFYVNQSLMDLPRYAAGEEHKPFQSRPAMMPLVRWAHTSAAMQRASAFFKHSAEKAHMPYAAEPASPEKVACLLAGTVSTLAATIFCIFYGKRHMRGLWWVIPSLMLLVLFTSYAARYESQFWYPYDLPHFMLFGIAAVMLLEGRWRLAFLLFMLDVPMRETSIYLAPVLLALGYSRGQFRRAALWAACMLAVWLPFYLMVARRFRDNPTDVRFHTDTMRRAIINPLHWPQVACAFAYLVLPFCFGWHYLPRDRRWFVIGMLPGLGFTAIFGIWYETRIWDEWMIPAAILLAGQAIPMLTKALGPMQSPRPAT